MANPFAESSCAFRVARFCAYSQHSLCDWEYQEIVPSQFVADIGLISVLSVRQVLLVGHVDYADVAPPRPYA